MLFSQEKKNLTAKQKLLVLTNDIDHFRSILKNK